MSNSQQNNLLINLISDRSANIAKALRFGRKFLEAGWNVHLSINMDAVVLVAPSCDLAPCPVTGEPLAEQLQGFIAEGGHALVGKECMKLQGLNPDDLGEGLRVASFPETERLMGTPGLKIITW